MKLVILSTLVFAVVLVQTQKLDLQNIATKLPSAFTGCVLKQGPCFIRCFLEKVGVVDKDHKILKGVLNAASSNLDSISKTIQNDNIKNVIKGLVNCIKTEGPKLSSAKDDDSCSAFKGFQTCFEKLLKNALSSLKG